MLYIGSLCTEVIYIHEYEKVKLHEIMKCSLHIVIFCRPELLLPACHIFQEIVFQAGNSSFPEPQPSNVRFYNMHELITHICNQ